MLALPYALRSRKPFGSGDEAMFVLFSASLKAGLGHQQVLLLHLPLEGRDGSSGGAQCREQAGDGNRCRRGKCEGKELSLSFVIMGHAQRLNLPRQNVVFLAQGEKPKFRPLLQSPQPKPGVPTAKIT